MSATRRGVEARGPIRFLARMLMTMLIVGATGAHGLAAIVEAKAAPPSLAWTYEIEAFPGAPEATLDGSARITVRNEGAAPVSELVFDLGDDAGASLDEGAGTSEGGGSSEAAGASKGPPGIDVQGVRYEPGGNDLGKSTVIEAGTMVVTLPYPVGPGEEAHLKIYFETRLSRDSVSGNVHRGAFFHGVDWYPRPRGRARHEVTLTLPESWAAVTNGLPADGEDVQGDGTKRVRWTTEPIRRFAFATGPGLSVEDREIELEPGQSVFVRWLYPEGRTTAAEGRWESIERTLRYLTAQAIPPPDTLSIVGGVPIARAPARDGLVVIRDDWLLSRWSRPFERSLIRALVEGIFEADPATGGDMRLLAGTGVYLADRFLGRAPTGRTPTGGALRRKVAPIVMLRALDRGPAIRLSPEGAETPPRVLRFAGVEMRPLELDFARLFGRRTVGGWRLAPEMPPESVPSRWLAGGSLGQARARFLDGATDAVSPYRQALILETLERHIGVDAMNAAVATVARDRRLGRVASDQLASALVESVPAETVPLLLPLVDQLILGGSVVDFAVESVEVELMEEPAFTLQERPGDARAPIDGADGPRFRSRVVAQQEGWVRLPAVVRVTFDDGTTKDEAFPPSEVRAEWIYEGPYQVQSAEIDPERLYPIDRDRLNNRRTVEPVDGQGIEAAGSVLFWLQNWLHTLGALS